MDGRDRGGGGNKWMGETERGEGNKCIGAGEG